ncbi:wall-associated receptor kinase-like 1 [Pistacia vera]|uniref:wall-associated receptor kinase-like 1 n=1 Tax=Pistacia vera TaxID=55513 RepID=UPI001263D2B5|nr:wall-associated receptor kinase-like 1 [Pistacia vera]
MVLQFLLEILILLSLPIKSNCTSTHGNDSISEKSFPNKSNQSSSYNQFDADRSSDKPFIKRTNLEFSREREQKNFSTGFHSCQAKFHRPPQQSFKASGQEDGDQRCSYTSSVDKNYNNYSKETARHSMTAGQFLSKSLLTLQIFKLNFVVVACVGIVILLVAWRWLHKIIKKRKDSKVNTSFFEQNGGLLLKQLLNSCDANVDGAFKLFTSMEIDKATDHFNVKRIIGQGGQGTVYKGMLVDGRIIAVKKSNVIDEGKIEEFINEVVILAQINHRNVVKLLGCCLETEVPLLVYEFIPNGTLSQYLHDQNEEFLLNWDTRLRIAVQVSSALSYMHSGASFSIFHRDIKSTNILLDNNYTAKVADFGASRSIAINKTHWSTIVLGTLGYLDPEYFQSSRLTNKSDVYSFGVVLVELLTGEKPICVGTSQENISLAAYFVRCMKEKCLFDILDAQVKQHGKKDEIMVFANLAKRCLSQNGKERPTMKEIVIELEGIQLSKKKKVPFRSAVLTRFSKGRSMKS